MCAQTNNRTHKSFHKYWQGILSKPLRPAHREHIEHIVSRIPDGQHGTAVYRALLNEYDRFTAVFAILRKFEARDHYGIMFLQAADLAMMSNKMKRAKATIRALKNDNASLVDKTQGIANQCKELESEREQLRTRTKEMEVRAMQLEDRIAELEERKKSMKTRARASKEKKKETKPSLPTTLRRSNRIRPEVDYTWRS